MANPDGSELDGKEERRKLFPTKWSAVVFVLYMSLFVNQGLLVTATKNASNEYNYNITAAVLLTEFLKLIVACCLYLRDHDIKQLFVEAFKNRKVLYLYFVPALMYCFYNNLAFINLASFDPTTYNLLLQFRVVMTAILFQILFKKSLSKLQWYSLILLTVGCIIKQLHIPERSPLNHVVSSDSTLGALFTIHTVFMLIQMFCSCFAGVYNEFLLKDTGVDIHIMIHNVFMYINSVMCNLTVLIFSGQIKDVLTPDAVQSLLQPKVIAVMVNSAGCGIVTSLFLKNLNSILKTFAGALELSFTAILAWIIFYISIDMNTVVSIIVVSFAIYIYSKNPVVNKPKETTIAKEGLDAEKLLPLKVSQVV